MIPGLPRNDVPTWLSKLRDVNVLPISELLTDSLYYPSCGLDGDPVKDLGAFVHSFIHVDYGVSRHEVWQSLHDGHHGFRGYSIIQCRTVTEQELTPQGWTPIYPDSSDGNVRWSRRPHAGQPFALWAIHERHSDKGDDSGPERFSLLYIRGDGAATFQALYHGNKVKPKDDHAETSGASTSELALDFSLSPATTVHLNPYCHCCKASESCRAVKLHSCARQRL